MYAFGALFLMSFGIRLSPYALPNPYSVYIVHLSVVEDVENAVDHHFDIS